MFAKVYFFLIFRGYSNMAVITPKLLASPTISKFHFMNRPIFTNLLFFFFLLTSCNPTSKDFKDLNKLLKEVEKLANEKESTEPLSFKKGEEYTVKVVGVADGDTFAGLTLGLVKNHKHCRWLQPTEKKKA